MDLPDFENYDDLRSAFIRKVTLRQASSQNTETCIGLYSIPKRIVRYWHDPADLPPDVNSCLESWNHLADEGFEFYMFDDLTAIDYISNTFGERERKAFLKCTHPAMRCDYLRMCFILKEGGLYVDADDVLIGDGWRKLFSNPKLKVQPMCYDLHTQSMVPATKLWMSDLSISDHIFYINNDPIAAPPGHPVLELALNRATETLLSGNSLLDIQSTTGPGNFTAAFAAHARYLELNDLPVDFELLKDWESIAEMRWNLSYRNDARNWRNFFGY